MAVPFNFPTVGAQAAAACLGVTPHRLRQLVREGAIKEDGRNKYRLDRVVRGYCDWLRDENRRSSKTAAASRLNDERANLVAVQVEERTGDLKKEAVAEAMASVDLVVGGLHSGLYSIPARVTSDLALRAKIEAEIERVLAEASEGSRRAKPGKQPGDDDTSTTAEENA